MLHVEGGYLFYVSVEMFWGGGGKSNIMSMLKISHVTASQTQTQAKHLYPPLACLPLTDR